MHVRLLGRHSRPPHPPAASTPTSPTRPCRVRVRGKGATSLQPAKPDQYRALREDDEADDDNEEQQPHYLEAKILRGRELAGEPRDGAF